MIIENDIALIGDFVGSIPVMMELSKNEQLNVIASANNQYLFDLISKDYNIVRVDKPDFHITKYRFDLEGAFRLASNPDRYYMSQAHFPFFDLPIPNAAPKAALNLEPLEHEPYDIILAPFSRSLPEDQKWQNQKWIEIVKSFPNLRFALMGTSKHDKPFINENNCDIVFDLPLPKVAYVISKTRLLLSVVTGLSHISFAVDTLNLILELQGRWGVHPNAIRIHKNVETITTNEVINKLKQMGF